jgi:hypothetical protein
MGRPSDLDVEVWLEKLGIVRGESCRESIPRLKRIMSDTRIPPLARLCAFLTLHTTQYGTEVASKPGEGGRLIPCTPEDVEAETHIRTNNLRQYLDELEALGLGHGGGKTKGQVVISYWVKPRQPKPQQDIPIARNGNLEGFSDLVSTYLKRYKQKPPDGIPISRYGNPARLEEAAQRLSQAENSFREEAAEFLSQAENSFREEAVPIFANGNSEKISGTVLDATKPAQHGSSTQDGSGPPYSSVVANGHPVDAPLPREIQRASPSSSSNGFPLPPPEAPISMPPSAPPQPTPDPDTPILEAAEESGISLDADAVRRLNAGCRKIQADATPEEIAHFVRVKGAAARKLKASNPPGFLIDGVPKCLEGEPFLRFRRAQAKAKADAEAKDARIAALPSQEELDAIREREEAEAEARIALLCPACKGLGRDVNNPWKDKNQCRACGGTGRRPESRGAP